MINKEAIAILENQKIQGKTFYSQRLALDLAIKALEFIEIYFPNSFNSYLNGKQIW